VVVAVKDEADKVTLHHGGNLIADNAVFRGFCGSLASLIFLNAAASRAIGLLPACDLAFNSRAFTARYGVGNVGGPAQGSVRKLDIVTMNRGRHG
jgi:uncharacterized membrane protein